MASAVHVELGRHRQVIIGSAGTVKVRGDGIMPRHAAITVTEEGPDDVYAALCPLQGPILVERRGRRQPVADRWRLADGDAIIVGSHRLIYRDLASPLGVERQSQDGEVVSWFL